LGAGADTVYDDVDVIEENGKFLSNKLPLENKDGIIEIWTGNLVDMVSIDSL